MRRSVGFVVVSVALGVTVAVALLYQPPAWGQGQRPKTQWEYRVVLSATKHEKQQADAMTRDFNALAADGWEYVGPVSESTENGLYLLRQGVFTLFRRPK
jgi:hypothetical protein